MLKSKSLKRTNRIYSNTRQATVLANSRNLRTNFQTRASGEAIFGADGSQPLQQKGR